MSKYLEFTKIMPKLSNFLEVLSTFAIYAKPMQGFAKKNQTYAKIIQFYQSYAKVLPKVLLKCLFFSFS
jgi:hypothetical protein